MLENSSVMPDSDSDEEKKSNKPDIVRVPIDVDSKTTRSLVDVVEAIRKTPMVSKILEKVIKQTKNQPLTKEAVEALEETQLTKETDKIMQARGYEYKGPLKGYVKKEKLKEEVAQTSLEAGSTEEKRLKEKTDKIMEKRGYEYQGHFKGYVKKVAENKGDLPAKEVKPPENLPIDNTEVDKHKRIDNNESMNEQPKSDADKQAEQERPIAAETGADDNAKAESSLENEKSLETVSELSETQQSLLLMEQSAAFYALQFGKDDPVAQDFEKARQELEEKMREELFNNWAKRTGYVGSPKMAEHPGADTKSANSDRATNPEAVSHAPLTDKDLQKLLEQPQQPEQVGTEEAAVKLEGTFNPLIVQANENDDNIIILTGQEEQARRKQEKPLKPKIKKVLRDAYEEDDNQTEERPPKKPKKKKKEEVELKDPETPQTLQTPEQKRADEIRKELARLAEIGAGSPEAVSNDIVRLQKELEQLERGPEKKHRGWGWIKERAKGLATIGFWEVHQAERLRSGTKEVAKDVGARTEEIQKTIHLNLEDALAEAEKIQFAIESAGSRSKYGKNTAENIERLSNAISAEKIEQNNRVIDETVRQAESELKRRLEKYRNEFGERVVTDDEAVAGTMNRLRVELQQLQNGQRETDVHEIQTVLRSLDPKYWRRYLYGGAEAALWAGGGYLAWTKLAADKAIVTGVHVIQPTLPGDVNMHNTIWQSSKELLVNHGVSNPTNAEVLKLAKPMADLNGIGVKAWHLLGHPMDTAMQQGYLLKVPKAALKAILSARGITP